MLDIFEMDPAKAERHRQFVSGCTGGSFIEIFCLLLIPCAVGYLRVKYEQHFLQEVSQRVLFALDLVSTLLAFVIPSTLLSNYILETALITCSTAALFHLKFSRVPVALVPRPTPLSSPPISAWRRVVRTYVLVYTCVCIYAVDFPIFPRRFAKTEDWGVSLMDTGVGLIAVSMGMSNAAFVGACRGGQIKGASLVALVAKSTVPCALLGAMRTLCIKIIGYPEHVSEYGVHWNFFITLALLRLCGFCVGYPLGRFLPSNFESMKVASMLSVVVAFGHQFGLLAVCQPLLDNLTSADRASSLLLANAEGLVSLPGYLCLFLYGTAIAFFVQIHTTFDDDDERKFKLLCVQGKRDWYGEPRRISMAMACLGALALLIFVSYGEQGVSRRLIGLMTPLMGFFVVCIFSGYPVPKTSSLKRDVQPLVTAVADNALIYFLFSNIVTGALNMLIDTLDMDLLNPPWLSAACQFLLLSVYALGCPVVTYLASA